MNLDKSWPSMTIKKIVYPYPILPVSCPNSEVLPQLDVWAVQEFFRIECLLRSEAVMNLYRTEGVTPQSQVLVLWEFGFPWSVFQGSHHIYLSLCPGQTLPIPGVTIFNFTELYEAFRVILQFLTTQPDEQKQQALQKFESRFIALVCDPALPPARIKDALHPLLEKRYSSSGKPPVCKPKRFDVEIWLKYLACYDLRWVEGKTYGVIAQQVYGETGRKPRDRAETAVDRVTQMIQAAEHHQWPPSVR